MVKMLTNSKKKDALMELKIGLDIAISAFEAVSGTKMCIKPKKKRIKRKMTKIRTKEKIKTALQKAKLKEKNRKYYLKRKKLQEEGAKVSRERQGKEDKIGFMEKVGDKVSGLVGIN